MARAAPVVCDLSAIQSPDYRGRGIGRFAFEFALALERARPDLVSAYLLDPCWPPPGRVEDLLATGKLAYAGTARADEAIARARLFHACSPLELGRPLDAVRPPVVEQGGLRYSAIVYDLIPLRRAGEYLQHPAQRQRYATRAQLLPFADGLLAISGAARDDAIELAGVDPTRCHVVGTGVADEFAPPADRRAVLEVLGREIEGLDGPFVLYTGGTDGRKNVEGLIAGFSRLHPDIGSGHRLVIVGDFPPPTLNHFRWLARNADMENRLVLTGFVADETLVRLCQATELMVFPSFAEGFGMPVAEALACGAVAAVSDLSPLDELVTDPRARFDPSDPSDIARVIERCLTDAELRSSIREDATRTVIGWDTVALRAGDVFDALCAEPPRTRWKQRRRIAIVSPFPPLTSGVAAYSASLVRALVTASERRSHVGSPAIEIDCFADGLDRYPGSPAPIPGVRIEPASRFPADDAALGAYDRVVYVLGNSECHTHALRNLRRRRGLVICHDVRMSGLIEFGSDRWRAVPGGLSGAIARAYRGSLPTTLGASGRLTDADRDRYGLLLLSEVLENCDRLLVSSEAALRLAELDAGPELSDRLGVLPFAIGWFGDDELALVEAGRADASAGRSPTDAEPAARHVRSFGIVDPAKRPRVLVEAVADLARRGLHVLLDFVGPVSDELRAELTTLAAGLGIADSVRLTGTVSTPEYLRLLGGADLAVQLREGFFGEASGAVAECLSAGIPTVVSDVGWLGGLPADSVAKVGRSCTAGALADEIERLHRDPEALASLSSSGMRLAALHTFDHAAEALLDELGY